MKRILKIALFAALFLGLVGSVCSENMSSDMPKNAHAGNLEKATFAGGCFWCMQPVFDGVKGVVKTTVGYTGGHTANPTYEEVSTGTTGHAESIEVLYDPEVVDYAQLLFLFWRNIDPTTLNRQFADSGTQYRTAIFYHDEGQKRLAYAYKGQLEKSGKFKKPIVTEITPASEFYPAEGYHQGYYRKHALRFQQYESGSGREDYVERHREDIPVLNTVEEVPNPVPSKEELKKKLTPMQYEVTCENGTEAAFHNEYWNNHREGIYVDIISGVPLFSSTDKFDSGTGWPSFTRPINKKNMVEKKDTSYGMVRTEVRSLKSDSHLGHIFDDGPAPTGMRYCINSAALRFIPKEDLAKEGYGEYSKLFRK